MLNAKALEHDANARIQASKHRRDLPSDWEPHFVPEAVFATHLRQIGYSDKLVQLALDGIAACGFSVNQATLEPLRTAVPSQQNPDATYTRFDSASAQLQLQGRDQGVPPLQRAQFIAQTAARLLQHFADTPRLNNTASANQPPAKTFPESLWMLPARVPL